MVYETLDSINTSEGLHTLYTYANSVVPILTPLLLFGLFLIVMMVSYFSSIRLRGDANFSASFAVAGFFIATVGTFMSFIQGMINITTLVVCYGVAIIGFMWLILDKN